MAVSMTNARTMSAVASTSARQNVLLPASVRRTPRAIALRVRAQQQPDGQEPINKQGAVPTKLTEDQLRQVAVKEAGNVSPQMAEMRADLGSAWTDASELQAFDGPAPETINGRLAMLGVVTGLLGEMLTGKGLLEQTANHPITVFLSFVLISIATYVPLTKGYTRKEAYANNFLGLNWSPKAENWNGRLAMMGFAGMVLTEAIAGCNTLQALGLMQH